MAGIIAAAAIGAAGAVAGGVISAQGAKSAAATAAQGRGTRVSLPGYAAAINQETARATALNMNALPPSLDQYVKSGGAATFPWQAPGVTPQDAVKLGLVTKLGKPQDWLSQQQQVSGNLTPQQLMDLAKWYQYKGKDKYASEPKRGRKIAANAGGSLR